MDIFDYDCTYCGMRAEGKDHIIPHSYASSSGIRDFAKAKVVPACRECNCNLTNFWFITVAERAKYIASTYKGKYKKLLASPDWDEDEFDDLGKGLKSFVRREQKKKRLVAARIAFAESRSELTELIPEDVWESWASVDSAKLD